MSTRDLQQEYRTLPLKNDFMFDMVMSRPAICKMFLESLLDISIDHVELAEKQRDLSDSYIGHGIRLDVYVRDGKGTVYNVEMQTSNGGSLERRIRFYQSGIDRDELKRGVYYDELSESYIIFICDFDYFGRGAAVYERESRIRGFEDTAYDDGSHAFLLNSRYTVPNARPEIVEFLDYIREDSDHTPYESALVQTIRSTVRDLRTDREMEERYMTFSIKLQEERRAGIKLGICQGIQQGIQQGVEQSLNRVIANMARADASAEQIAGATGLPIEEVKKRMEELAGNTAE